MVDGPRRTAAVATLAGTALLAAACAGGGGGSHTAAPKAALGQAAPGQPTVQKVDAYAQCMRSHGIRNFYITHPGAGSQDDSDTTLKLGREWIVLGVHPGSPKFHSAQMACNHLLGLPAGPPAAPSAAQLRVMVKAAACLRSHGYPNWPDPAVRNGQLFIPPPPPGIDTNSPRFQAAEKSCHAAL